VVRAFSSPKRILGVLFFLGYMGLNLRTMLTSRGPHMDPGVFQDFDAEHVIPNALFGLLVAFVLFNLMSLTSRWSMNLKQPDVDVLFPTPVHIKYILAYRVARDTISTLVLPLFLSAFFMAQHLVGLHDWAQQQNQTSLLSMTYRVSFLGWALQSVFWASAGLAVSLLVQRQNELGERAKKWIERLILLIVLGTASYFAWLVSQVGMLGACASFSKNLFIRILFFPATASASIGSAPLTGDWLSAGVGTVVLLVATWVCARLVIRQSAWYYENYALVSTTLQSQVRGGGRQQDLNKIYADRARKGKIKVRTNRFSTARWKGMGALIWKEIILQNRTGGSLQYIAPTLGVLVSIGVWWGLENSPRRLPTSVPMAAFPMIATVLAYLSFVFGLQLMMAAYQQMLRLGDLQKPLPFTPSQYVRFEILAKAALPTLSALGASLAWLVLMPRYWIVSLCVLLVIPTWGMVVSGLTSFIVLVFPDDDPTQKGFKGLMTILGMILFAGPPIAVLVASTLLKFPILVGALLTGLVNVGMAFIASEVGGRFYASFNPSE